MEIKYFGIFVCNQHDKNQYFLSFVKANTLKEATEKAANLRNSSAINTIKYEKDIDIDMNYEIAYFSAFNQKYCVRPIQEEN